MSTINKTSTTKHKSRTKRSNRCTDMRADSHAENLLHPLDILDHLPTNNLEDSWNWFANRLNAAGFQQCGLLITPKAARHILDNPERRLFGTIVSEDYLNFVRENPAMLEKSNPYKMISKTRDPITFFTEEDYQHHTPAERALAERVLKMFNIEGWALYPIHAADPDRMFALGWWDFQSTDNAQKLWSDAAARLTLATTYFCESISHLIKNDKHQGPVELSAREMECLLWAGAGKTTSEIATILSVADGTVEEYFRRAARKLGATTRTQACVKAVLAGLIKP